MMKFIIYNKEIEVIQYLVAFVFTTYTLILYYTTHLV